MNFKEMLDTLHMLPSQDDWDNRLLSDEFIDQASKYASFTTEYNRIINSKPCTSDSNSNCQGFHYKINVAESLRTNKLEVTAYMCPYKTAKSAVSATNILLDELNIPRDRIDSWTFSNLVFANNAAPEVHQEFTDTIKACKIYARDPKGWLYLWSYKKGVGKTRLAIATAISASGLGARGRLVNVPTMFSDYKGMLGVKDTKDAYANMVAFELVPALAKFDGFLILDDIGREYPSYRLLEMLYIILDSRYMNGLPTIFTSNCAFPDGLKAVWADVGMQHSDAIISRMSEMLCNNVYSLERQLDYRSYKYERSLGNDI